MIARQRILFILLAACAPLSAGCTAATRAAWSHASSTAEVAGIALAEGHDASALLVFAGDDIWMLPLDSRGRLPTPLDLSALGGRPLEALRDDPSAVVILPDEPEQAASFARQRLRRVEGEGLALAQFQRQTPMRTRIFRIGEGLVVAFYEPRAESDASDRWLPNQAVLLPERLPRPAGDVATGVVFAVIATPVAIAVDGIGTVGLVASAFAFPVYPMLPVAYGEHLNSLAARYQPPPPLFPTEAQQ